MSTRGGGWVAGALAVSVFAIGCMQAKKPVPAGIEWNQSFSAALVDAQAHHRPILLDFYLAGRNPLASMVAEEPAKKDSAGFVYRLADRFADHGLFDDARKRFLIFVALDPKNVSGRADDALYRLARMARKEHDYATDRKYAQMILDRYPDSDMM